MNRILALICILLFAATASAQNLSVFNLDASAFPTIKAKFYAFDAQGNQQSPSAPEIMVMENGIMRNVTSINCPLEQEPQQLSSVLVMDVSGSMASGSGSGANIDIAKAAATYWISNVPLGESECAITSFDDHNYFNQDYTTNRNKLANAIAGLAPQNGTDYNAALLLPMSSGLEVTKLGKHQRVIVFLSDGLPNFSPQTSAIIAEAQKQNCMIFSVTVGLPCPQCLQDISNQTGAKWFENITTQAQIEEVYQEILEQAQGGSPCEITWKSDVTCVAGATNVQTNVQIVWNGQTVQRSYTPPASSIAHLQITPQSLYIRSKPVGVKFDTTVTITANNSGFTVTNITSTNPAYDINPKSFTIVSGESKTLTVSYTPPDSSYTWTRFDIATDLCAQTYYASGSYPGHKPLVPTLKLTQPNGGEFFVVGTDTVITWKGIPLTDTVKLEYSTDAGNSWNLITDKATGGRYAWHVQKRVSDKCLISVMYSPESDFIRLHDRGGMSNFLITPDEQHVINLSSSSGIYDSIKIWDLSTRAIIAKADSGSGYIAFDPNTNRVLSGGTFVSPTLIDLFTGKKIFDLQLWYNMDRMEGDQGAFSKDGKRILCLGRAYENNLRIYNAATGDTVRQKEQYDLALNFSVSPAGKYYAIPNYDGNLIEICNVNNGSKVKSLTFPNSGICCSIHTVNYNANGTLVAAFCVDSTYKVWDVNSAQILYSFPVNGNLWSLASPAPSEIPQFSPDGSRIAIQNDSSVEVWELATGTRLYKIIGIMCPENGMNVWTPNGSSLLLRTPDRNSALLIDGWGGNILRTFRNVSGADYVVSSPLGTYYIVATWEEIRLYYNEPTFQSDTSDTTFSIIMPQALSKDVDMGSVLVSSAKDSVIKNFIRNGGSYPFRVDSITITGADASQFALVSGIPPFDIPSGGTHQVEFDFHPTSAGIKNAKIHIYTQADTLVQNITGTGIAIDLFTSGSYIDFGKVEIGTYKDTTIIAAIENRGNTTITFSASSQLGPDMKQFTLRSVDVPFTLGPGASQSITLRFAPKFIGRTSGRIAFANNGANSPTILNVFGQALGGLVMIPDDSGYGGDHKNMPLILENESLASVQSAATNFRARIAYDHSVLTATGANIQTGNKFDTLTVTSSLGLSDTLAVIPFTAIAGYKTVSPMRIVDFTWLNGAGLPAEHDAETESGIFHILGKPKPFEYQWEASIVEIYPNPANESFHFQITTSEASRVKIELMNILGQKVATIFDGVFDKIGAHDLDFSTRNLLTGSYYMVLTTPSLRKMKKVDVIR